MNENVEEDILVSVCCITYNHEAYVAQAIESILMQQVDFKIELLIHDDASTDRTAELIRNYEQRYPEKVKPIYQVENQYSKGIDVDIFNWERVQGKYIAYCEGDDYWSDPLKLQKQVAFMEQYPEVSMCVHASNVINRVGKVIRKIEGGEHNSYLETEEIIRRGGGVFATNSMMLRAQFIKELPTFYYNAPIGDYPLAIFYSLRGKVYYMKDNMSVYRYKTKGSWSERMSQDYEAAKGNSRKIISMLNEINEYTEYQYTKAIQEAILKSEFNLLRMSNNIKEMKEKKYIPLYKKLSKKQRLACYLYTYVPFVMKVWRKVKRRWLCIKE